MFRNVWPDVKISKAQLVMLFIFGFKKPFRILNTFIDLSNISL